MKITIFAGSSEASFFARCLPLAKQLGNMGVKCTIVTPLAWDTIVKGKLGHIFSVINTYNPSILIQTVTDFSDAVVIEKAAGPQIYIYQKYLKKKKVKVLFDLNDAVFLPTSTIFGINIRAGSFFLEKILAEADYVTTNGHYLESYAKFFNENVSIIHDPIDVDLFHPKYKKKSNERVTITWEGNARVNLPNLNLLLNPLKRLSKEFGKTINFKIVSYLGDQRVRSLFRPLEEFIKIDYGPETWLPMEDFARLIYDTDIMVSPLQNTQWNEGKSILRVGIAMAMGVPVIASPVGEQKYFVKNGINGFLARNDEEWYNYLKILIKNEELRKELGLRGRIIAEKEFSTKNIGKKFYNIITNLVC